MVTFTITNKQRARASIIMLVSLFGTQYRKSIGASIPARFWNERKKCAKITADFDGREINDRIERFEAVGKRAARHFMDQHHAPTREEFVRFCDEQLAAGGDDETPCTPTYTDYFERTYIERYKAVRGIDTIRIYRVVLNKLRQYEAQNRCRLRFEDIDIDFYNRFQTWFFAQGFSRNYFGNVIKVIRQVYKEAGTVDGLHALHGTDHRDFIAPKNTADAVYLTLDELDRIARFPITEKTVREGVKPLNGDWLDKKIAALKRARGFFLIGCYTGLRVSDFSRLSEAHVGKYITIKTHKTGVPVVIPIHPVVRQIIDSGFDLSNTVSDQKLNDQIKELCRLAGITEEVMINRNVGGKDIEVIVPKYKLISSHTARRSFATNAYKAGVPTIAIMKITGHKLESTFLKYIKVSAEENAELLSDHPFFCGEK